MGVRPPAKIRSEKFKEWVRGFPCLIQGRAGHVCSDKIQFAHVRKGTDGGMGLKPSDCFGVPACSNAHVPDQHQIGERAFEIKYGVDLNTEADWYWAEYLRKHPAERARFEEQQREAGR